jgi:hypothetical protein
MLQDSTLSKIFNKHNSDKTMKHMYHLVYEPHFDNIRYNKLNILEVGVFKGESINAWLEYFPNATVYGIDIFERVKAEDIEVLNHPRVKWSRCDSTVSGVEEWKDIEFDIIIDDGLHTPTANMLTFKNLSSLLKKGGLYFIEDVWPLELMSTKELEHSWLKKYKDEYLLEDNEKFLYELKKSNMIIKRHDNRTITGEPDSYIIELRS